MRVHEDTICMQCKKIFCCANCRSKHELKTHAIQIYKPCSIKKKLHTETYTRAMSTESNEIIYLMCPLCEDKPLLLQADMYMELLDHIQNSHLPLRCQKCKKVYRKIDDLKDFGKCFSENLLQQNSAEKIIGNIETCDTNASKETITKSSSSHSTISTQTSPIRREFAENVLTPISIVNINLKPKNKVQDECGVSDSLLSNKDLSSISNSSLRRSIGTAAIAKGGLIRSTSTPVQFEMVFAKPREQVFNGTSGGHVSSIYGSSSESDISLAAPNVITPRQTIEVNRYRKAGGRVKLSAVTPLRQVMSRSIQKAFAEHGGQTGKLSIKRSKNIFDVNTSIIDVSSSQKAPLDLRSSPVIRRTQSESRDHVFTEPIESKNVQQQKPQKVINDFVYSSETTESIVIRRTKNVASIETTDSNADSNLNSSSTSSFNFPKNESNKSSSNVSGGSSTSNAVFKSCHSIEIITSSEINTTMENQVGHDSVEQEDKLYPIPQINHNIKNCIHLTTYTPITRIPGANINKKLIKFDTPNNESVVNKLPITTPSSNNDEDVFFTPNSTPMRSSSDTTTDSSERRRQLSARNLTRGFSPLSRPSIRECAQSTAFSRIENCCETFDDDVFLADNSQICVQQENPDVLKKGEQKLPSAGTSRLWSIMSSVIRLSSLKPNHPTPNVELTDLEDKKSNSILKRCASIAGSFVRSKPLVDSEQLQSLKRKRTYTADHPTFVSPVCCANDFGYSSVSTKRFRIQPRKPIDRMRVNSCN